jgi:hypothetical protein
MILDGTKIDFYTIKKFTKIFYKKIKFILVYCTKGFLNVVV